MRVLLVEPDRILARLYHQAFEQAGHEVVVGSSAQAAVHAADGQMPDAVVLELELPRHNGIEFLYEFRSYPEWLHIPIVIHSFVRPGELEHSPTLTNELGVCMVLYKPATSLNQLVMNVERSFDRAAKT